MLKTTDLDELVSQAQTRPSTGRFPGTLPASQDVPSGPPTAQTGVPQGKDTRRSLTTRADIAALYMAFSVVMREEIMFNVIRKPL